MRGMVSLKTEKHRYKACFKLHCSEISAFFPVLALSSCWLWGHGCSGSRPLIFVTRGHPQPVNQRLSFTPIGPISGLPPAPEPVSVVRRTGVSPTPVAPRKGRLNVGRKPTLSTIDLCIRYYL